MGDNTILSINVILYLVTFLFIVKKRGFLSISSLIVLLYSIATIASFMAFVDKDSKNFFSSLELYPFLYMFMIFIISIIPIMNFKEEKVKTLVITNKRIMNILTFIVIFIFSFSIFDIVNNFSDLITNFFFDTNFANDLYLDSRANLDKEGINIVGVLTPALRDFPHFLLFYFLALEKKNVPVIVMLIIVLILSILSGLVNGLRGNVVFVFLSSIFCFFIFKRFYSKQLIRRIKIMGVIGMLLVAVPFVIVSKGRFDTGFSTYRDSGYAAKMYAGQSFIYFNNYAFDNNGYRDGDRILNLFKRMFWDDVPKNWIVRRYKYNHLKISDEVFSTYIGDFVIDFGPMLTLLLVVLTTIFFSFVARCRDKLYIHQLLVIFYIWNSISFGIFLFPYADISGNIRIVIFVLLFMAFYFLSSPEKSLLIHKKS